MEFSTDCIAPELSRFDQCFEKVLHTRVPLANNVIRYFLGRKGKRMRPTLVLLAAKMLRPELPEVVFHGATAIELLHNATLMHDDVVDQCDERRGRATVNKVWDNKVAVLMGDFFLAKCLESSNATGSLQISGILAGMVTRLAEGELEQLANARSHMLSEEAYFSVISGKTASMFAACMRIAAYGVGASDAEVEQLAQIGEHIGLVFQIRDDIFDYFPTTDEIGKPTGHDIQEGKVTLPLLYALQHAPADEASKMKALLERSGELSESEVSQLVGFAHAMGGIEYAQEKMKSMADEAKNMLSAFPDNASRQALMNLVDYFMTRNK